MLFAATESKPLPVIVTTVSAGPLAGLIAVMDGGGGETVNTPLAAVPREFETVIAPVCAPAGTMTTSCVAVALTTLAATVADPRPANVTVLFAGIVSKPVPVKVT
jgi:hypothetical protein